MTDDIKIPAADLPPLWIVKARSFTALMLTLLQMVFIMLGIDATTLTGVATGVSQVLDGLQMILPVVTVLWMYAERLAPSYRLSLTGK